MRPSCHGTDTASSLVTGAVWAWDKSKAVVRSSVLQADSTYVVLTHGDAHADIQVQSDFIQAVAHALHLISSGAEEQSQIQGLLDVKNQLRFLATLTHFI